MADHEPPDITLTTTASLPVTQTTSGTQPTGGRRNRNINQAAATANNSLRVSNRDNVEPFPSLPSPSPALYQTRTQGYVSSRTSDYFPHTPLQNQVRQRPIGIRRLQSSSDIPSTSTGDRPNSGFSLTRRRADTAPKKPRDATADFAGLPGHYDVGQQPGSSAAMRTITEGEEMQHARRQKRDSVDTQGSGGVGRSGSTRLRRASNATRSFISKISDDPAEEDLRNTRTRGRSGNYESDVVDYLDVLDPEVSTLTTLNNLQNSLFVPDIPFLNRFYNRRPTYNLSRGPDRVAEEPDSEPASLRPQATRQMSRLSTNKPVPSTPEPPEPPPKTYTQQTRIDDRGTSRTPEPRLDMDSSDELNRRMSITSHVDEEHYAVLPHGVTLEGWTEEDVDTLDDYVRHMLHSRRSRFKRSMRGFGKYIRKPLGFFVTLYAFLITAFGLIWVLFLIGWVSLGDRKDYIIHIVDSVLVGLFAIMGDGLAPFRCVDTYHMIYIQHYHRLSWRLRKEKNLPKLVDHNDLPERTQKELHEDAEAGLVKEDNDVDWEFSVLTPQQQKKLRHHQDKFSKSHSYYRPHETTTHHAFPLKLLITIVSLLDAHSILQISLGSLTWGWSYHTRPGWITAVILSISITVNITAGILISVGDKRTRKKEVLLRMARQGLTEEAMRKVEKRKREEGNDENLPHVKRSVVQAHMQNVKHGVIEDDGVESGTDEIKEKLSGYKRPVPEEQDGRGEIGGRSKSRSNVDEKDWSRGKSYGGSTSGTY